jgi:hypothetical protein
LHRACPSAPGALRLPWRVEGIRRLAGTARHVQVTRERSRQAAAPSEAVLAHRPAFRAAVGLATIELAGSQRWRHRTRKAAGDPTHQPPPSARSWSRFAVPQESLLRTRAPRSPAGESEPRWSP